MNTDGEAPHGDNDRANVIDGHVDLLEEGHSSLDVPRHLNDAHLDKYMEGPQGNHNERTLVQQRLINGL